MKNIVYKFSWILLFPLLFACTQPEYLKPDKSLVPKAADIEVNVTSAYDENFLTTVTFEYVAPSGTTPIFIFDGKEYVTKSKVVKTYKKAGTYAVEVKALNSHGISDGSKLVEFVVEYDYIAPYDPTEDIRFISGGTEKIWVMDAATKGHLGCGEPGSDGTNWWSANPYEKEGFSMYDNQLTFRSNGTFKFDPVDGMIYVNAGSGYETSYKTAEEDYMAPAEVGEGTYSFEMEGDHTFLKFPEGSIIGYIPNPEALSNPTYRVITLTASVLELVVDNGGIAWHFRYIPLDPGSSMTDEEKLTGGNSKSWKWNFMSTGHLGCGAPGTDGLGWWSAPPMDKNGVGMYDDILTFAADGTYTMDPGAGGTVYVNKDSGVRPDLNPGDGNDYAIPFETQTTTWNLYTEGGVMYLEFPAETVVGYVPNPEGYATPRFRVLTLTKDLLEIAIDAPGITWHYSFVPAGYEGDELGQGDYAGNLAGAWTWEPSVQGHFGCGPSGGNGLDWWSAPPYDKQGVGLYDDILTFGTDGSYVYDPGPGGTVYCNWESGFHPEYWGGETNVDYGVPVDVQTASYVLEEGVLTFPPQTFVSYLPNAATYDNPVYRIVKMTPYIMELVTDNGNIAWHYRFQRYVN